jgi:hypothetical protein
MLFVRRDINRRPARQLDDRGPFYNPVDRQSTRWSVFQGFTGGTVPELSDELFGAHASFVPYPPADFDPGLVRVLWR